MSDVDKWGESASDNTDPTPDGAPERHARTDSNDIQREVMSGVRRQFEDPAWFDKTKGPIGKGYTITRLSDVTVFFQHELTPTDATSKFPIGARCRVGDGSTLVYGFVTEAAYANPSTFVTLDLDGAAVIQAVPTTFENSTGDDALERTAYYPTGTTLAQDPPNVPTIDDLGSGATKDEGHGNGFDADTVDGLHADDLAILGDPYDSGILNGNFEVWQRGESLNDSTFYKNDNGAYCADQWALLMGKGVARPAAGSGTVDIKRVLSAGDSSIPCNTAIEISGNSNAGSSPNEKFGVVQWLPNDVCAHLHKGSVSLSCWVKKPAGSNMDQVRLGVVQYHGTADTVVADFIDDWEVAGVLPTVKANYTLDVTDSLAVQEQWTEHVLEDVAITIGATNVGVIIYVDDTSWTSAASDIILFAGARLVGGASAVKYKQEDYATNQRRCARFFWSSFPAGDVVDDDQGISNAAYERSNSLSDVSLHFQLPVTMFKIPTLEVFNPGDPTHDRIWNDSDSVAEEISDKIITKNRITVHDNAISGTSKNCYVHITAEAVI